MFAGEAESKDSLCFLQHAPAQSIEDRLVNECIGLGKRSLFSGRTHRFGGEPARSINPAERPKHQGKKPHDDERQVQRRRPKGRRVPFDLIGRECSLEMPLRVQVIASEPAGYPVCPVCDNCGHRRFGSLPGDAHDGLRQLPHRRDLAVGQAGIEQAGMDRRQFDRVVDVGCEFSGPLPGGHRFGGAVAKAAPQRAAIYDLELQSVHGPARLIGQRIGNGDRLAEMCDRLGIGRTFQGLLAGLAPPFEGYSVQPGFSEVKCQNFRLGLGDDWKLVAQNIADVLVEQLPPALEQALVSRFLNERMLEAISRLRRCPVAQ